MRVRPVVLAAVLLALEPEALASRAGDGHRVGEGRGLDARQRGQPLPHLVEEALARRAVGVVLLEERHARREHPLLLDAEVGAFEPRHALDHEPGEHEQDAGDGDLRDHQGAGEPPEAEAGGAAALVLEDLVDAAAGGLAISHVVIKVPLALHLPP